MTSQLTKLATLAEMIKDAELAKLNQAQQHVFDLRSELSKLRQSKFDTNGQGGIDAACLTGADQAWGRWVDRRRRMLNVRLAQAAAEAETQKQAARRAFGRASVLRNLAGKNRS